MPESMRTWTWTEPMLADVRTLVALARREDLGERGDVTTRVCGLEGQRARAAVRARDALVVCGGDVELLTVILGVFECDASHEITTPDGARADQGDTILTLEGDSTELLTLERTLLNVIGRLSGVATHTARFVEAASRGGAARVLDTRKTTPGWRTLEKYAVVCGGGSSHRMGLHDAVLIKDNHIAGVIEADLADVVTRASERARAIDAEMFVEVEVDRLSQLEVLLTLPMGVIDVVLLDNFALGELRRAVDLRDDAHAAIELEASGGVTLQTIEGIAGTGVDRISVGSLTHGAVSADVGLDFE